MQVFDFNAIAFHEALYEKLQYFNKWFTC